MKKILLILLLTIPFIVFGQTAEEYFNKAFDYGNSGKYQLAIENYTKCLRIDPDYAPQAYYNRGWNYGQLENYEDAIADYTRAIRIAPDYAAAYYNRGTAKWYLKLEYCSDFKRACDLGSCDNYNNFCKSRHRKRFCKINSWF